MKNAVISAVGGLVVGSVVSYLVTKRMVTKFANEEIESVKATYKAQYDNKIYALGQEALKAKLKGESLSEQELGLDAGEIAIGEQVMEHLEKQIESGLGMTVIPDKSLTPFPTGPREDLPVKPEEEAIANAKQIIEDNMYNGPSPEEANEPVEDEDIPHSIYDEAVSMDDEPFALSYSQYHERLTDPSWTQVEFTYYEKDDVVADARDVVPNPEMFVGDGLSLFGQGTGVDDDEVYIRNERLEADYHVTRVNKSFSEDVLGFRTSSKMSKFTDDDE